MTRAALAGCCIALSLQVQQPPRDTSVPVSAPAGTASIEGTVLSDEAQPKKLRRALVAISGPALPGRVEITDDEGRFRFLGLAGGQYSVTANKPGYAGRAYGSSRPIGSGRGAPPGPANLSIREGETRAIAIRLPRGAAITGSVTDPNGQPVPGTIVVVMGDRFDRVTGVRRLQPVDATSTDDRGVYRSFDLAEGQYIVYAQASTPFDPQEVKRSSADARTVVVANTYYPSTTDGARATQITLGAGEERAEIDIQVQYVPTATVKGFVSGASESQGVVRLTRPTEAFGPSVFGFAPVGPDGQFTFTGVAPGQYEAITAGPSPSQGGSAARTWMWGSADVVVDGDDVTNLGIQMMPTFAISGRVAFEGSTPAPPLAAMPLPTVISSPILSGLPPPSMQLLEGRKFAITGLMPGAYRPTTIGAPLRGLQSPIGPWWLKSIAVDGRELLDAPLELRQGSEDGVVTFSDQASEVSGSLKDASGAPIARGYVVIFSADRAHWFVSSRRVVGVPPDVRGWYSVRNLPPGEYRAAVALDLEQGEWFDPDVLQGLLPTSVAVTISGTEAKTVDLIFR